MTSTGDPKQRFFSLMHNEYDHAQVLRSLTMVHGRLVNGQSQVYQLAADDEEVERLGEYFD